MEPLPGGPVAAASTAPAPPQQPLAPVAPSVQRVEGTTNVPPAISKPPPAQPVAPVGEKPPPPAAPATTKQGLTALERETALQMMGMLAKYKEADPFRKPVDWEVSAACLFLSACLTCWACFAEKSCVLTCTAAPTALAVPAGVEYPRLSHHHQAAYGFGDCQVSSSHNSHVMKSSKRNSMVAVSAGTPRASLHIIFRVQRTHSCFCT